MNDRSNRDSDPARHCRSCGNPIPYRPFFWGPRCKACGENNGADFPIWLGCLTLIVLWFFFDHLACLFLAP
jgi:predicted nucleic acid-binding Zn ribbon protein